MYGLAEHETLRQTRGEILREAAMERPTRMAREDSEPRPYVVRDLSWELVRYLDTQIDLASTYATPNSAIGRHGRTREEARVGD